MDPVSLIMAALAAGAVAGAQGTATNVVKDAYAGLKALVKQRFTGRPAGELALEQHEIEPEPWTHALEVELIDADAASDSELVTKAQQLMGMLDQAGSQAGKYTVDLQGAQGVQVGDGNAMHNSFGERPRSS